VTRFAFRLGGLLFFAFALGALFSFAAIDSVFHGGFAKSIKIFWLPFGGAIFGFTYLNRKALAELSPNPWRPWVVAAIFYPLSLWFGWGYLMAINTLSVEPVPTAYSGPVTARFVVTGKRATTHHIRFRDGSSGESIELRLLPEAYSKVEVGATYCAAFHRGLLGIPFRWRSTSSSASGVGCTGAQANTSSSS
jgi:hypothetical protein